MLYCCSKLLLACLVFLSNAAKQNPRPVQVTSMGHWFHPIVYQSAESTVTLKCIVIITEVFLHFINLYLLFGGVKLLCFL